VAIIRLMMDNSVERHKLELVQRKAAGQKAIVHGDFSEEPPELTYDDFLKLAGITRAEVDALRKKLKQQGTRGGSKKKKEAKSNG